MDRSELLLSLFESGGTGLEIGPSFNPLLPKSKGYNVEILDHLDSDGLREKYKDAAVDLSLIEEVDYVSDGGSIAEIIGKPASYDYCVALHVIEHTVDMLGFLLDCEKLLKDDGVLVLAIPDKRFSFDVLRPTSSTGDVLQAHYDQLKSHPAGKIFDEFAYNCLRDGLPAWPRDHAGKLDFFRKAEDIPSVFEWIKKEGKFIDIHAWQFTPSSFRLIVNDLASMGFMGLKEREFRDTGAAEFYMTLSKSAEGCRIDRMTLARDSANELKQINF